MARRVFVVGPVERVTGSREVCRIEIARAI